MKYLLLFLLVSCESPFYIEREIPERGPYPGKKNAPEHCKILWENHYEFSVKKCEEKLSNPEFKVGQEVLYVNNIYDKTCRYFVAANHEFSVRNTDQVYYKVTVQCNDKIVAIKDALESKIRTLPKAR